MSEEMEFFNEALGVVCETAKVNQALFMDIYGKEPSDETSI